MPLQYSLTEVSNTPVGNPAPPSHNVYLTIFAGRKRYLDCLTKYLDVLLQKKVLTEVHLWDYARDPSDSVYIQHLCRTKSGYIYKKPIKRMTLWNEYYEYYINANYNPNDVLIKCDDDVVYMDVQQFSSFINEIKPNTGLYFPNIVNNDVCAYIQMKYGIHNLISDSDIKSSYGTTLEPMGGWSTGWYARYDCADAIHADFLRNPSRYSVQAKPVAWKGRISINMFAAKYQDIKNYFKLFIEHGKNSDEEFFSHYLYNYISGTNYIVPFMTISHFSFGPQKPSLLDEKYLNSYKNLTP